ncbi:amphi-Trp domain-containing protein [Haloferax namakaokahaiae]|uniref:Amphi-Trp domain-containing protein n=1 Tax=Haloferax namakaokahaiae TaxID=1748331 RepID=A0ABD5ZCI0_9EURY
MGELETQAQLNRGEVAAYLRQFADQLDGEGDVRFELGGYRATMTPSNPVTFKVEAESEWEAGNAETKQRIEFELVWWQQAATAEEGALNVERETSRRAKT